MNDTERRFLRRLAASDSKGLSKSQVPTGCQTLVEALQTCGAVQYRPAASGRGLTLRVCDEQAFNRFIEARLPGGLGPESSVLSDRGAAVAMLGDAKAVRQSLSQGLLVRAPKPGIFLRGRGAQDLHVSELTQQAGVASLELSSRACWAFSGRLAIIENADAFWQSELVLPDVDLAVLAAGRMSRRLISWLGSDGLRNCQITHWGDYDPVGVCEYMRLATAFPDRVDCYAPDEIDQLLPRFGKRELVTKQTSALNRLRRAVQMPYVSRMLQLFDAHRRGLEQELLLHRAKTR